MKLFLSHSYRGVSRRTASAIQKTSYLELQSIFVDSWTLVVNQLAPSRHHESNGLPVSAFPGLLEWKRSDLLFTVPEFDRGQ